MGILNTLTLSGMKRMGTYNRQKITYMVVSYQDEMYGDVLDGDITYRDVSSLYQILVNHNWSRIVIEENFIY